MKKIKVLNDRIAIELVQQNNVTQEGLIIPDTVIDKDDAVDRLALGKIYAIGPDCKENFDVGNLVLFRKFGSTDIILDGKSLLITREQNIVSMVDGNIDTLNLL